MKLTKTCADSTLLHTAPAGREVIVQELDSVTQNWEQYVSDLQAAHTRLDQCLQQWQRYEDMYENLLKWIKDTEKKVKDMPLVSTLDEKQAQVKRYQVCTRERMSDLILFLDIKAYFGV